MIPTLKNNGHLPKVWGSVAAARTYNPLGSDITFMGVGDIVAAVAKLDK